MKTAFLRNPWTWAKLAVTIALIAWLISRSDPARAISALRGVDPLLTALAVVVLLVQVAVAAGRWREVTTGWIPAMALGDYVRFTYVAQFFNQLLPAGAGGDAVRVWLHHLRGASVRHAFTIIAADRYFGVGSLFVAVFVALAVLRQEIGNEQLWAGGMLVSAVGTVGTIVFPLAGLVLAGRGDRWRVIGLVRDICDGLRRLLRPSMRAYAIIGASLAIHAMSVFAVWLLTEAIHLHVAVPLLMVGVPFSLLASTIPVSLGGWGLREGTLASILAANGADFNQSLAVSLLFGLSLLAVGIIGASAWIGLRTQLPAQGPDLSLDEGIEA
jgi:uncharacterized membrane protein YbhN (UPF0104 family)